MARTIDGICNYCGQSGRVRFYDASPLSTRWCPDTEACDERWQEQVTGVTVLTTTNTVSVTTTVTTTTTRTTRKGRTS